MLNLSFLKSCPNHFVIEGPFFLITVFKICENSNENDIQKFPKILQTVIYELRNTSNSYMN